MRQSLESIQRSVTDDEFKRASGGARSVIGRILYQSSSAKQWLVMRRLPVDADGGEFFAHEREIPELHRAITSSRNKRSGVSRDCQSGDFSLVSVPGGKLTSGRSVPQTDKPIVSTRRQQRSISAYG